MKRILLLLLGALSAAAQGPFALKPGDRVVFFGDSITDQRLYTTFVETYVLTRFPKAGITFTHSGWGGDRVSGGGGGPVDVRLYRDVIAYNPTVVTVMLGMNDGRYRAFDPAIFGEFTSGYEHLVKVLKGKLPGVRMTLIQPSPYDDVTRKPLFEGGYNAVLVKYGEYLKELTAKEKLAVADMNTPVVEDLRKAFQLDEAKAAQLIPDRVHPGAAGHLLMAKALLAAWNAPAVVSEVELDGPKRASHLERTSIRDLKIAGQGITWLQMDEALPLPIDRKDALLGLAVKAGEVNDRLNRQMLRVRGLMAGSYELKIDGQLVARIPAEALDRGVNVAEWDTPMSQQAAEVHAYTLARTGVHNTRWRQIQVPLERRTTPEVTRAILALDELEAVIAKDQRAAAQPVERRWELTKVD